MGTPPAQDARSAVELGDMIGLSGTTERTSLFNQSEEGGRVTLAPGQQKQPHDRRGLIATFILQLACFLWLAPIVTLLTFNFKPYIIGASAWCPNRNCHPGLFNPIISVPLKTLDDFDKQDHDLLGALQFVAKLLEIWFTLIVAALVSLLTFRLAKRDEGLPIGLLTRPASFADLPGILDPLLWKVMPSASKMKPHMRGDFGRLWKSMLSGFSSEQGTESLDKKPRRQALYVYVILTVFLCVVCNLMGPAVAVLVLPSLQWKGTKAVGDRTLLAMGADIPPQMSPEGQIDRYWSMYTGCTQDQFDVLNFSCAADTYASKLDSWIGTYIAAGGQVDGLTQEWSVKFRVNQTLSTPATESIDDQQPLAVAWWVPCRQILSSLDDDLSMIGMMSQGLGDAYLDDFYANASAGQLLDAPATYNTYNNSLLLNLQRVGPILGAIVQMHFDLDGSRTWTSIIDEKRKVRCFSRYSLAGAPFFHASSTGNYTKCVRVGSGWSERNLPSKQVESVDFSIVGEWNYTTNATGPGVNFSIYSSDKAQFFPNGTYPSWLPLQCLKPGQVNSTKVDCDWERLFYTDPNTEMYNRTQNVLSIEMSTSETNSNDTKGIPRLTVDFVAFLNFTTYEIDASPLTNPAVLATAQSLPETGDSIRIDPAWMLAAWTVDNKGILTPDRTATTEVLRTMQHLKTFNTDDNYDFADFLVHLSYISLLPVTQALSMIDYNTTAHGSTEAAAAKAKREPRQYQLSRTARMYVWTYGINGRTSKFGVTVACIGIAIVLVQSVLGFVDRSKCPSLEQLLVAALEYVPKDDFRDVRLDKAKMARTRFLVNDKAPYEDEYVFARPRDGV